MTCADCLADCGIEEVPVDEPVGLTPKLPAVKQGIADTSADNIGVDQLLEVRSPAASLGSAASATVIGDPVTGPTQAGGSTISLGQLLKVGNHDHIVVEAENPAGQPESRRSNREPLIVQPAQPFTGSDSKCSFVAVNTGRLFRTRFQARYEWRSINRRLQ